MHQWQAASCDAALGGTDEFRNLFKINHLQKIIVSGTPRGFGIGFALNRIAMVDVRQHSEAQESEPTRFNVLVTGDRPRPEEYWTRQLSRLLEPLGVATHMAFSGSEALDLADRLAIHAAVVDMATPMDRNTERQTAPAEPATVWLKQLARHLPNRPIVVIHGRVYSRSRADRSLRDALGFGAFCVLHKPVEVEQLLRVFQRMLDRRYQGGWPENQTEMDPKSWR